ncbi:MAG: epoxyqueuosine reductase [Chloroflexota bacterium]
MDKIKPFSPNTEAEAARLITSEIVAFTRSSPLNRLPGTDGLPIFDEPLVQFADGDDPIFTEYKTIIDTSHLTPREALAKSYNKMPKDMLGRLSVISWILPLASKVRESNRRQKLLPSRFWSYGRWYGEKFNDALRKHVINLLTGSGYLAAAPLLEPYFDKTYQQAAGNSYFSNWSERHIAYAAGLGTFSLSDGFITPRGIAHRCGSVITDLKLPASPRTAADHRSNCLFYVDGSCLACIARCPAGAITENGHDKLKCHQYSQTSISHLLAEYDVGVTGCGLCQAKVPCEFHNPAQRKKKK